MVEALPVALRHGHRAFVFGIAVAIVIGIAIDIVIGVG